jgi:RES domain-containing protein
MHPPDELARALATLASSSFQGVVYRAVDYEAFHGFHQPTPYPRPRPLYGLGAAKNGARFTPRGTEGMATLYAAEDRETAFAELDQVLEVVRRTQPTAGRLVPPAVLMSAEARLDAVLDLTLPAVQQELGTTLQEIRRPWRRAGRTDAAPTQLLGAAVFASQRFQAIRYPSARLKGGVCLAIFPVRLAAPSFVAIFDPHGNLCERLP